MKMKTLVDALPALQKLAKQELTIKTLYKVSKLLSKLDEELAVYTKARNSIIEKYCVEENGTIIPKEESVDEFNEKFIDILEFEIDSLGELPIEIPLEEKIALSYNDLNLIKAFIVIKE